MGRPTIHKDGTPLTPTERVQRCRAKKRREREERIHEACADTELEAIDRREKAAAAEALRAADEQLAAIFPWYGKPGATHGR